MDVNSISDIQGGIRNNLLLKVKRAISFNELEELKIWDSIFVIKNWDYLSDNATYEEGIVTQIELKFNSSSYISIIYQKKTYEYLSSEYIWFCWRTREDFIRCKTRELELEKEKVRRQMTNRLNNITDKLNLLDEWR